MTSKLEITDDGPNTMESNQLHTYTFLQVDQSQDSQNDQNRQKKRRIKRNNKRQKQDTNDKNYRRPFQFSDFVTQKLDEKEMGPSISLAANEDDPSEEIKDATQRIAQNFTEDEEDDKDQYDPDWTDSKDDNVHEGVSDDHHICHAEWEERESNAEFEMIKELDRLDRDLDGQEEEVLWAFMNSGSRIQMKKPMHNNLSDIHFISPL
ncbi:hypothetical protein V1508DRAFT_450952 [Lipomyces doorenjongii]|uniref:uncharacterized protein n=1 Tax=Lipomyces doorenjongii TaxID=383834 RepID=UPI0034CD8FB4